MKYDFWCRLWLRCNIDLICANNIQISVTCRVWNYGTIYKSWPINGKVQGNSVFVNLVKRLQGTQLCTETTISQTNVASNKIDAIELVNQHYGSSDVKAIVGATCHMPQNTTSHMRIVLSIISCSSVYLRCLFYCFSLHSLSFRIFLPFCTVGTTFIGNLLAAYYIFCTFF